MEWGFFSQRKATVLSENITPFGNFARAGEFVPVIGSIEIKCFYI
jgi:hypothetical protein